MKNEFIKKLLKGAELSLMSSLITASVFFGSGMTALAEEPDDINIDIIDSAETYTFEENNLISLEDYIDHEIDIIQTPVYNSTTFAGSKLTGINKTIYEKGKTVVEQVANGDRDSSVCSFTLAELGIDKQYTLKELGITSLSTQEEMDDAYLKLVNASGFSTMDIRLIANAIRSDCPYERYWMGLQTRVTPPGARVSGYTFDDAVIYFTGDVSLLIEVNNDYMGSDGVYSVNTSKTKGVKNTINTVNGILAEAKNKNDREKVDYYKERICGLVEYNDDALTPGYPYGDPWQLVYVFDNDPSTNVVCEGYSKAFNYLCEKTQFSDPSILCYTVTGFMGNPGETGEGHMWNVVHWNNNTNYMVDVTNTDIAGDELFMVLPVSGDVNNGYVFKVAGTNVLYK